MYYMQGQRPSPSVVLDDYDGQMISLEECGLNFLTFLLRLSKKPGKKSTKKLTRSGIEPGPGHNDFTPYIE